MISLRKSEQRAPSAKSHERPFGEAWSDLACHSHASSKAIAETGDDHLAVRLLEMNQDSNSARGVATNRRTLTPHPSAANIAPSTNASVAPSRPTRPKQSAASAAPVVCPVRRAVATTPLALPLRSAGALDIKAFMLGAWK